MVELILKATVILAAAAAASWLLRKRPAAERHLLWTLAAGALLLLPVFSVTLPEWRVPVSGVPGFDGPLFRVQTSAGPGGAAAPSPRPATTPPRPPEPRRWQFDPRAAFAALWALGAALGFLRLAAGAAAAVRVRRRCAPAGEAWREALARSRQDLGIARPVDLLEAGGQAMPMACGLLRPAVIVPSDAGQWDAGQRRAVLLHELAHVRRYDVLTHLVAQAAWALYWFHPLAWYAAREMRRERERACDDLVLEARVRASDYAAQLLEIARGFRPPALAAWAGLAMARRSQLEGRLLAILDSRRRRAALRRPVALAAAALTLAVLLPFAAVRAQEAVPSSPAELKQSVERAQAQGDAAALDRFAEALARTYHYHEAAEAASAALGLHARRSGENSVEYGRALLRLAGFTSHIGKDTETTQHYRRAVEILEPALGAASAELAPAFSYLGYRAQLDKNYDQAEAYYNRIPATAGVVARLAMIAEARGRMADAEAGYLRAMNMGDGQSTENAIALDYYAAILRQDPARAATAADFAGRAARIHQAAVQAIGAQAAPPLAGGPITPLRVGGGVTPPSLLFKIEPAYSETARLAKFQGTVVLYIVVGPDGVARDIRLVKGLGKGLDERAAEAITQWRFRPGQKDGQPVSVAATIEVNFRLL